MSWYAAGNTRDSGTVGPSAGPCLRDWIDLVSSSHSKWSVSHTAAMLTAAWPVCPLGTDQSLTTLSTLLRCSTGPVCATYNQLSTGSTPQQQSIKHSTTLLYRTACDISPTTRLIRALSSTVHRTAPLILAAHTSQQPIAHYFPFITAFSVPFACHNVVLPWLRCHVVCGLPVAAGGATARRV